MIFYSDIKRKKEFLKNSPGLFFKDIKLVLSLPFILFYLAYNKIKYEVITVYLTKLDISEKECTNESEADFYVTDCLADIKDAIKNRGEREYSSPYGYLKEVEQRFREGSKCFYLKECNKISSFLFLSFMRAEITPVKITEELGKDEVAVFDVYTFPKYRGKNYYPKLFNNTVRHLRGLNIKYILLWLMEHNNKSLKVHYKIGFRHIHKVYQLKRIFGLRIRKSKEVDLELFDLINQK